MIDRLIPQGAVDNNQGQGCLADPNALEPNHCRQPTTLIARPLSGSRNSAWLCVAPIVGQGILPTHTIYVTYLT